MTATYDTPRDYRLDLSFLRNTVIVSVECPDESTDLMMVGYSADPVFGPIEGVADRFAAGELTNDLVYVHTRACDACQRVIAEAHEKALETDEVG